MKQGKLIVFEGISGTGKSTLIDALMKKKSDCVLLNWFSTETVKEFAGMIHHFVQGTPEIYSTIYVMDFLVKEAYLTKPLLNSGKTVLSHRYIYSPIARDVVCGTSRSYLDHCYRQHVDPSLVFYFDLDPAVALERIMSFRKPSFYECGLDVVYREDLDKGWRCYQEMNDESISKYFIEFQNKVRSEYVKVFETLDKCEVKVLDALLSAEQLYETVSAKMEQI